MAKCSIGLTSTLSEGAPNTFQISWNPNDFANATMVLTGPDNTFKYV